MARKNILVCTSITAGGPVVPGTLQIACSECGEMVYVSPSSWIIIHDNPGLVVLCIGCATVLQATVRTIQPHAPSPAQIAEIMEYLEAEG